MPRVSFAAALLSALVLLPALAGGQPIGVEEIGRSDLEVEGSTRLPPRTAAALSQAGDIYAEGDSEGAIPLLQEVIDTLEPLAADAARGGFLVEDDPRLFDTLRTAWLYLAAARWTLDDRNGADQALDRIIRLDPLFELDPTAAGQQLTNRLERRKNELVGRVTFFAVPRDAEIRVDNVVFENATEPELPPEPPESPPDADDPDATGDEPDGEADPEPEPEPFVPADPAPMLVGDYFAQVTRPGYLPSTVAFTIAGGRDREVNVELERDSAVIRLRTAPTGATVLVNGIERGTTSGQAELTFRPEGPSAGQPPENYSRELWLDDLPPGSYRIDVEKEGFRSFRTSLQLPALEDYELLPIILEREEGVIALTGLVEGASVRANGRVLRPDFSKTPPQVRLAPGAWDLSVTHGTLGYFETSVVAEDRRRTDIDVRLRPALVYLGVLGDDPAGVRAVESAITVFRDAAVYTVLDRGAEGPGALAELGIDVDVLRSRASAREEFPWQAVQDRIQANFPAALYLAAVLNDDLVADAADLWWWPAAPGPPKPDVRTLRIENRRLDQDALARLTAALDPGLGKRTPRLGAALIDSLAASSPIVAAVEPGSPAEAAGLRPGMEVLAINGEPAASTLLMTALLEQLEPGDHIELEARGPEGTAARSVEPVWGWTLLDVFDRDLLPSAATARLLQELERAGDVPRWLLELNLANLLLASGDLPAAIRQLRTIDAPRRNGLGRDTVQYLLGLALTALAEEGRGEYRERARTTFEALAAAERGRLESDAGPTIPLRARLHAEALADNR